MLLTIAENGNASLRTLVLEVAVPVAAVILVLVLVSIALRSRSVRDALLLGLAFGALSTAGLELVRNIGFYEFQSMPGQLPELMGVLITNRIMDGPDLASNIVGWTDHIWNGAMFGVTYALVVGGFPRRGGHWMGAGVGATFGLLIGTGFLLSPVSRATGAGIFGSNMGPKYAITVYLAHLAFGGALGWLVHRFGSRTEPIWERALNILAPSRAATSS